MSLGEEDGRRLLETHADIRAAQDPSAITAVDPLQAAIAYTRQRLVDARALLVDAIRENARELGETAVARDAVQKAATYARNTWRHVRGRIEMHLLNPPPDLEIDADEMTRREKLLARIAPLRPSDLARMSPERMTEYAQALRAALDEPVVRGDLGGLDVDALAGSLDAAIGRLHDTAGAVAREIDEDREATHTLSEARGAVDQASTQHAMMVEVALRDAGRLDRIGRFIRARDAAYRARRRAGRVVAEEPDLNEAIGDADLPPLGRQPLPN